MEEQAVSLEGKLKTINYHKPLICNVCGSGLRYTGVGEYECTKCGRIMLDDYGKVRKYVTEKKSATATEIARDTKVAKDVIDEMLKSGALESSAEIEGKVKCVSCGKPIPKGRYCNECIWKIASGLKKEFAESREEKQPPKEERSKKNSTMYTFDKDRY